MCAIMLCVRCCYNAELHCGALQTAFHCMLACSDMPHVNRKAAAVHVDPSWQALHVT